MVIFESTPGIRLTMDHYNHTGLIYRRRFDGEVPMVMISPYFIRKFSLSRYPGNYETKIVPARIPELKAFIFRKAEFTPKVSDNGNNIIELRYFILLSYEGQVLHMHECANLEECEVRLNATISLFNRFKGFVIRPYAEVEYTAADVWGTTIHDQWCFRAQEGSIVPGEILVRGVLRGEFASILSTSEWFGIFVDRYKGVL